VVLFINARVDTYLRRLLEGEPAEAETVRRAALYRKAGADGSSCRPTEDALIGRLAARSTGR